MSLRDILNQMLHLRHNKPMIFWVDDNLYCINRAGDVSVIKAASKYELLAINSLGEKSQATTAVADGMMYLRTYSHLISIGGKTK